MPAPLRFTSFSPAWTGMGVCSGATRRTSTDWSSAWGSRQGCRSDRRIEGSERPKPLEPRVKSHPHLERRRQRRHRFRAKRRHRHPRRSRLHPGASRCTASSASFDVRCAPPLSPSTTISRFHHRRSRARRAICRHRSGRLYQSDSAGLEPCVRTSFYMAKNIPKES